jgi:hypothetical protein
MSRGGIKLSGSEKEALLNVFAALVRPLMRAAFEYGITAGEIAGVVRRVYIQALEARLVEQKRPTTDSRLAVVSGLPKSDVSAVREALRSGATHGGKAGASADQVMNLLSTWHTHSNFSGAYGLAMDLDIVPTPGSPRRSFQELVDTVCPGVDRDTLLDELIAAGSVEIVDGNTARCLSRAYISGGADTAAINRMGWSLETLMRTMVHNLLRTERDPNYFERFVVSDFQMSEAGRDHFLTEANERGQALLVELDTFLTALTADQPQVSGKKYGVGIYFFEDQAKTNQMEGQRVASQVIGRENSLVQEIDVLASVNRKQ